jgi:hypothetical protein
MGNPAADVARWALERMLYGAGDAFVHPPGVQVGGSWNLLEYWPDLFGAATEPEQDAVRFARHRASNPALTVPSSQIDPAVNRFMTVHGQPWTGGILVPSGYLMGTRYYQYTGTLPMPETERPGFVNGEPQPLPLTIAQPAPPVRPWAKASAATAARPGAAPTAREGSYTAPARGSGSAPGVSVPTSPSTKTDPLMQQLQRLPPTQVRYRGPETKLRMPAYKAWMVTKLLEGATEAADFIGAIHAALPPSIQRECKRKFGAVRNKSDEVSMKVQCIAGNISHLDPEGVVRELVAEAVQDAMIGAADQVRANAMGKVMKRSMGEMAALKGDAGKNLGGDWFMPMVNAVTDGIRGREARHARQAAKGY